MGWPGEQLLIKLWETLADKGIGNLLKPWQTRRQGLAEIAVKRFEVLALADAEKQADEIRAGRFKISQGKHINLVSTLGTDATIDDEPTLHEVANRIAVSDTIRKEVNVAKAISYAEDSLRDDPSPPSDEGIDPDWLFRWRDYASGVSSDEAQELWGRILAGEVKNPGACSYRLLEFVRNLTTSEAQLIGKIAPFVLSGSIPRNSDLGNFGISNNELRLLQEFGILSGLEALGLSVTYKSVFKERFACILRCHKRGLVVEHADPSKNLKFEVYPVTSLGSQVFKLGSFEANEEHLIVFAKELIKQDFNVSLADVHDVGGGQCVALNLQAVSA